MNYTSHPQCTFCAEMNRYMDLNQRDRPFYQVKSYSNYQDRPLLYCYDMTQRPIQDNYITYCNLLNRFPSDNEPQYVQVVDSNTSRVQFCVPPKNGSFLPTIPKSISSKAVMERNENNCGVVLCTCNDFINSNLQNRIIYDTLPGRNLEYSNSMNLVSTIGHGQDSIDSRDKSVDEQPDNSIYSGGSLLSEPMCRFCHLSKNTTSDQLISPCYCCGTLKYVHQNCLKTWLEVSKKQRENNGNKPPHCELCNFKYVRKRKFQYGRIRQPKLSQNDCALHLIFLCSLLVMVTSASVTILCFAMEKSAVGSNGNRGANYEKPLPENNLNFHDRKSSDPAKSGNLLCEYFSNLNLKDYSQSHRQSASKLSVLCDLMMNKERSKPNRPSDQLPADSITLLQLPKLIAEAAAAAAAASSSGSTVPSGSTQNPLLWKKDFYQRVFNKHSNGHPISPGSSRMWILSPEEAVTLASGVIFFIAFFIAMVVQVKSSYTCYQLVLQWVRLNYSHEVQSVVHPTKKPVDPVEMKSLDKTKTAAPREYIERCVTEI